MQTAIHTLNSMQLIKFFTIFDDSLRRTNILLHNKMLNIKTIIHKFKNKEITSDRIYINSNAK